MSAATAYSHFHAMSRIAPEGTNVSRDDLLQEYAPLVRRVAYKIAARLPHSVEVDDLISTGVLGLMDAIKKFDPIRSNNFRSYAEIRIRGAILDELRNLDWVPRSVRQRANEIEETYIRLERETGRSATEDEVAMELGLSLADFHALVDRVKPLTVVSFEDLNAGGPGEQRDVLACIRDEGQPDPHAQLLLEQLRGGLEGALDSLPEKQRLVLSLYYFEDLNLKEIGRILGVTESRICQLHSMAVIELRAGLKTNMMVTPDDEFPVILALAA
jgi:RNA polymerase sigma factor for flagellar operon FliA